MEGRRQRLLTAGEVAAVLHVGLWRVYELNRLGILRAVRIGRQVRWDEDRLRAFIAAGGCAGAVTGKASARVTRKASGRGAVWQS